MESASVAVIIICGFFTLALSWVLFKAIDRILMEEAKKVEEKWFPTVCCYCGKDIEVKIRKDWLFDNPYYLRGNACYKCVPKNSSMRNGFDESAFDVRDYMYVLYGNGGN